MTNYFLAHIRDENFGNFNCPIFLLIVFQNGNKSPRSRGSCPVECVSKTNFSAFPAIFNVTVSCLVIGCVGARCNLAPLPSSWQPSLEIKFFCCLRPKIPSTHLYYSIRDFQPLPNFLFVFQQLTVHFG